MALWMDPPKEPKTTREKSRQSGRSFISLTSHIAAGFPKCGACKVILAAGLVN